MFIGVNTIILPGVTIGDNVIIGAGSVVSKNIPSNTVAAGVPAKPIKSLEAYEIKLNKEMAFPTKSMKSKEKRDFLRENKPEWF